MNNNNFSSHAWQWISNIKHTRSIGTVNWPESYSTVSLRVRHFVKINSCCLRMQFTASCARIRSYTPFIPFAFYALINLFTLLNDANITNIPSERQSLWCILMVGTPFNSNQIARCFEIVCINTQYWNSKPFSLMLVWCLLSNVKSIQWRCTHTFVRLMCVCNQIKLNPNPNPKSMNETHITFAMVDGRTNEPTKREQRRFTLFDCAIVA